MAYFTAVLARTGSHWKTRDIEVDEFTSLDDLADALRGVAHDEEPVLAVVEHEDEWFAMVRVDGQDDPRVFVSDFFAASRSPFGDLLALAGEADVAADDDEDVPGDPAAPDGDDEDAEDVEVSVVPIKVEDPVDVDVWAGECDLLEDLGVKGTQLRDWVKDLGDDPAAVLAQLGDVVGFSDQLEALR